MGCLYSFEGLLCCPRRACYLSPAVAVPKGSFAKSWASHISAASHKQGRQLDEGTEDDLAENLPAGLQPEARIGGLGACAHRWWSEKQIVRNSQRAWGRCIGATRCDQR